MYFNITIYINDKKKNIQKCGLLILVYLWKTQTTYIISIVQIGPDGFFFYRQLPKLNKKKKANSSSPRSLSFVFLWPVKRYTQWRYNKLNYFGFFHPLSTFSFPPFNQPKTIYCYMVSFQGSNNKAENKKESFTEKYIQYIYK